MGPLGSIRKFLLRRDLAKREEAEFWYFFYGRRGHHYKDSYERRVNPESPLLPAVARLVDRVTRDRVSILDVGAGPITGIGFKHPSKAVRIKAVDELADEYDKILYFNGVKPPVRTRFGRAEELTRSVKERGYHIVTCINALDHTSRPDKAVREMLKVVKPGGFIFLSHHIDEANSQDYTGEHQWNFSPADGDMVMAGKRHRFSLRGLLPNSATLEVTVVDSTDGGDVEATIAVAPAG
jgi:SAM-dependent methyltransferase